MKHIIKDLLIVAFLGAFGGIVNTLVGKPRGKKYDWKIALPEVIIAIFAGFLMHRALQEFGASNNYQIIGVSLAGYSARGVLNIFNKLFLDKLKNLMLLLALPLILFTSGCMNIKSDQTVTQYYDDQGEVTRTVTETKITDKSFTLGTKGGNEEVNIIPLTVGKVN